MIDAGETPKEAAARELAEETGYQAAEPLIAMGTAFGNPTGSSARHHMFLAPRLPTGGAPSARRQRGYRTPFSSKI